MLQGKGILTALQKTFLAAFSALPDQDQFHLTGGTALAEFYLGHRLSSALDFFTAQAGLIIPFSPIRLKRRFLSLAMDLMSRTLDVRSRGSSEKS